MTHVVTDACIRCKYMDCVECCPTQAFHAGANMLVINPDECIDCAICVPECPVDAIQADTERALDQWLTLNAAYSKSWPNITKRGAVPADAADHRHEKGKFDKYFSPEPSTV